jgi:hypothetical protein
MSVVIHIDAKGKTSYFVTTGIDVFTIDENCQHDRVFRLSPNSTEAEIEAIIGKSPVGHSEDERHPAISARVSAFLYGERHLKPVESNPDKR